MPNLSNDTYWNADITITRKLNTLVTMTTDSKYVDKNIQLSLNAQSGVAALTASASSVIESTAGTTATNVSGIVGTKSSTEPSSGYFIRVKSTGNSGINITTPGWLASGDVSSASANTTDYYQIYASTVTVSGSNIVTPSASLAGTNATLSDTNNGISVTATGGGTASASATATATEGYVPAGTAGSATLSANSTTTTASKYISGVTLAAPSSGTRSFAITVPNGDSTVTFTFTVDASGNVVIE